VTPRSLVLLLALVAATCARVSPEELAAQYELDKIQRENLVSSSTSTAEGEAEPEPKAHQVQSTECPFEVQLVAVDVECGFVSLPGPDDSPTPVRLSFARFRSSNDNPEPNPVIYLHGGPGGSVLADAHSFYGAVVSPFIDRRDVIVYDQRGGGESSPLPVCDHARQFDPDFFLEDRDHADISDEYLDILAECGQNISNSFLYDLTTYNSVTHANDTIELARALKIDQFNIHASSYGTKVAQTILRDHPQWVRSAILTGFYPTEVNLIGSVPSSFESALQTVFDACAADAVCGPALRDPWTALDEAIASFNDSPLEYESPYFDVPALIDDDEVVNGLHALLYLAEAAAMIPDALIDFRDGDLDRLTRIGASSITDIADVAGFVAVQCNEEAPFTTTEQRDAAYAQTRTVDRVNLVPGFIGSSLLELCAAWDTGTANAVANEPTTWNAPTLMFSGGLDPITPPGWAFNTAERLDNVTLVHFPDRGHDADESLCAVDIMQQFIERPGDAVDTGCADGALLQLDNNAGRMTDQGAPAFVDSIFDVEPGEEISWVDVRVPDWEAYFIEDEDSYYRQNDWLDPTILVVRNGSFNSSELTWYLESYVDEPFVPSDPPDRFAGVWERRLLERIGTDMIAYVHIGEPELTVALTAETDELATLERAIVFPVLQSFNTD